MTPVPAACSPVRAVRVSGSGGLDPKALRYAHSALQELLSNPAVCAVVLELHGPVSAVQGTPPMSVSSVDAATLETMEGLLQCLERASKPVVAVLQGVVAGLLFELSLACSARVAEDCAALGLPDVVHGLIPGAGTLQRLARLIGIDSAWELVHKGETRPARQLESGGLLDKVVESGAVERACTLAQQLARDAGQTDRLPRARDLILDGAATDAAITALRSRLSRRQQLQAVLKGLLDALHAAAVPFEAALVREQAIQKSLRDGHQACTLAYVASAEQTAALCSPDLHADPRTIRHIAVIGAGTMGTGIAISALDAGCSVTLIERDQDALNAGWRRISEYYQGRVRAGRMKAGAAAANEARLRPSTDWGALREADLVIEAVFEDLDVKRTVFAQIDTHARAGAVLATNTSYLDINAIAAVTSRPHDVLGLHFFSPANVMKLLEVVRTESTAPDVVATGMALARRLGKIAVISGQSFGFIGNRIYNAYRRQCECMLEDGAWPEDVDSALEAFGFAMGPFAVADLSGLDIAWRMRRAQAATRDARERYVPILDHLCEVGRLGRKANAGYYTYAEGKRAKTTDAVVRGIITAASAARGITRRVLAPAEIQQRALLAMANEAALVVAEGVAARHSDVDVVLVQGYGFPRWEGGPLYWARHQDRAVLEQGLLALGASVGYGFKAAEMHGLQPHAASQG